MFLCMNLETNPTSSRFVSARDRELHPGLFTYFGGSCGSVRMFLYQREIGEELRQLLGDFPSDSSGSVLQFGRRHPAGNNVVSVDLQKKTRRNDSEGCYFHTFLTFREGEMQKSN